MNIDEAKRAIDNLINIGRIHLYKPIQIAEILHRSRTLGDFDITNLEDYRVLSRHWRDTVSMRLVGNTSTSSARYQDDVFGDHAVPPEAIIVLDQENRRLNGIVESYIYHRCGQKWSRVFEIMNYLDRTEPCNFELDQLLSYVERGLRTSMDKMYEVVVYALFKELVASLEAQLQISVSDRNLQLINDFFDFAEAVLNIPPGLTSVNMEAKVYRAGVANAADTGIDIVTNFGVLVQVKHVTLNPETAQYIVSKVRVDRIIIVCKEKESEQISLALKGAGFWDRIQAVITEEKLNEWYKRCLSPAYVDAIGRNIIKTIKEEFVMEFPFVRELSRFLEERGYDPNRLTGRWRL